MAATCLQGSAVLSFNYSNSDDRKTFFQDLQVYLSARQIALGGLPDRR
ncbi:MAG: hypothetical protein KAX63_06110 [Pseudomonas sp.]|nr:hypothetical protein [Pseudomonas sp.]